VSYRLANHLQVATAPQNTGPVQRREVVVCCSSGRDMEPGVPQPQAQNTPDGARLLPELWVANDELQNPPRHHVPPTSQSSHCVTGNQVDHAPERCRDNTSQQVNHRPWLPNLNPAWIDEQGRIQLPPPPTSRPQFRGFPESLPPLATPRVHQGPPPTLPSTTALLEDLFLPTA